MSSDSDSSGGANGRRVVASTLDVAHGERRQVNLRRRAQGLNPLGEVSDVVGLALSGGGVRSGAVSLGLLQGLDARGVLPYVDYLSTVSGGGYAGAYLSSAGLNAEDANVGAGASGDQNVSRVQSDGRRQPMLPITPEAPGSETQRMRDFVHGGHYLRRSSAFANRYAIGLLQIWLVVFSGLLAFTSLIVLTFKQLDHPGPQEFLSAMGFDSDIKEAFFPSFILLVLWLFAWLVSYFRKQGQASGVAAQYIFYALILVTVVAIASLLGTGDISLASPTPSTSRPANETIHAVSRTVLTVLIGAIGAALLPYLSPKRLLRSGTSPESKPLERYVFWIASRALLFGVPFLFISFFARENISGWNAERDDSLYRTEINDWDQLNPQSLLARGDTRLADASSSAGQDKDPLSDDTDGRLPGMKWWFDNRGPWTKDADDNKLAEWMWLDDAPASAAGESSQEARVTRLFSRLGAARARLNVLDSPMDDLQFDTSDAADARLEQRAAGSERLSLWRRWRLLGGLLLEWTSRRDWEDNLLRQIWVERMRVRNLENGILAELNGNLSTPEFLQQFPDRGKVSQDASSDSKNRYRRAFERAELVYRLHKDTPAMTAAEKHEKLELANTAQDQIDLLNTEVAERERMAAHRDLLKAYYDMAATSVAPASGQANQSPTAYQGAIQDKSTVYATVVLEHDQATRWAWFGWSLLIFLVSSLMVSLNATSWHGYYSTRLADMWIEPVAGQPRGIQLTALKTAEHGYPLHLISGTVQLMGRQLALGRRFSRDHFLLSQQYCGSERLKAFCPTSEFMNGSLTLADAIAISGGAFTPTQTSNPLLMALLVLGNLRLGQWLDNPRGYSAAGRMSRPLVKWLWVSPLRLMAHWFQRAEARPFCFVTDGGHHENLGIEPLLKRRCRLIIACDAGQDDKHSFLDLSKLLGRARIEDGITLRPVQQAENVLKLDFLVPDAKQRYTKEHFLIAEIIYPEQSNEKSYLIYIKSSLTGDEPTELIQYHRYNAAFPHDPTADQFYEPDRFAAYAQLGNHIAQRLCGGLPSRINGMSVAEFIDRISQARGRRQSSQYNTSEFIEGEGAPVADGVFDSQDGSLATGPWQSQSKRGSELREPVNQISQQLDRLNAIAGELVAKPVAQSPDEATPVADPAADNGKATQSDPRPQSDFAGFSGFVGIQGDELKYNQQNARRTLEEPGVFGLYDNGVVVYYGSSSRTGTVRAAIERQFRTLRGKFSSFKQEPSADPKLRELELLNEHLAHHGKLPPLNA
jgi:hypothetical protein